MGRPVFVFAYLLAVAVSAAFAGSALSQNQIENPIVADAFARTEARLARAPDLVPRCFPPVSGPLDAHVISTFAGGVHVDPEMRFKSFQYRFADIRVEPTAHPIMLMLGNEYPVIWRVDAAPGAKIAGVLLNGHYPAMIEGLPDGVSIGRIAVEWLESSSPLESGRPYDCAPPDGLTADQAERLAAFVARGGIGWPLDAPNPTILEVLERAEQTLAVLGPLEVVSYQGSGQGTLNRMTGIFEFSATVSDATRGVFRHDGRELIPSADVMAARERTMRYLTPGPSGVPLCLPEIAGPADVHVLSSYDGGNKLDPSLARTTGYADVRVEPTEKPVLLVLSSYENVIWRIDAADDARIAGILLSGYHPPMIDGVPDDVSVGRVASKWAESLEDYVCEPNPTLSDERRELLSQLLRTSNPSYVDNDELGDLAPILDFMGGFDVLDHQDEYGITGSTFTVPAR